MKIEINVEGSDILILALSQLKEAGLKPSEFKMLHTSSMNGGERGEGNLSHVKYTFQRKTGK